MSCPRGSKCEDMLDDEYVYISIWLCRQLQYHDGKRSSRHYNLDTPARWIIHSNRPFSVITSTLHSRIPSVLITSRRRFEIISYDEKSAKSQCFLLEHLLILNCRCGIRVTAETSFLLWWRCVYSFHRVQRSIFAEISGREQASSQFVSSRRWFRHSARSSW